VKLISATGMKFPDAVEAELERFILASSESPESRGEMQLHDNEKIDDDYLDGLRAAVLPGANLAGMKIVMDCANGAASKLGPRLFRSLGADVIAINDSPNGRNINADCGSLHPEAMQKRMVQSGASLGVAFDGDADRALFVDETGAIVGGDHVMFALGRSMQARGELQGGAIVATVMSNIGFERALRHHGIGLIRAAVGDRYVIEQMRAGGYTLGGEQSGHIIDFRHNTTGDGPRSAVTLLGIIAAEKTTLHELVREVVPAPQVLVNVRTRHREVLNGAIVREAIAAAEAALGESGRLLVRASGTEPLIRVMAEGDDRALVEAEVSRVAARIEQEVARFVST